MPPEKGRKQGLISPAAPPEPHQNIPSLLRVAACSRPRSENRADADTRRREGALLQTALDGERERRVRGKVSEREREREQGTTADGVIGE